MLYRPLLNKVYWAQPKPSLTSVTIQSLVLYSLYHTDQDLSPQYLYKKPKNTLRSPQALTYSVSPPIPPSSIQILQA